MSRRDRRITAQIAAERLMADIDSDEDNVSENGEDIADEIVTSDVDSQDSESEETDNTFNNQNEYGQCFLGADGTQWVEVFVGEPDVGRYEARNIIRHRCGPTSYIINCVTDERDIFVEIFGRDWFQKIVQ